MSEITPKDTSETDEQGSADYYDIPISDTQRANIDKIATRLGVRADFKDLFVSGIATYYGGRDSITMFDADNDRRDEYIHTLLSAKSDLTENVTPDDSHSDTAEVGLGIARIAYVMSNIFHDKKTSIYLSNVGHNYSQRISKHKMSEVAQGSTISAIGDFSIIGLEATNINEIFIKPKGIPSYVWTNNAPYLQIDMWLGGLDEDGPHMSWNIGALIALVYDGDEKTKKVVTAFRRDGYSEILDSMGAGQELRLLAQAVESYWSQG